RTADAARGDDAERDRVTGRDVLDAAADLLDDTGALVPEHHWPAPLPELAVGKPDVGVADACGGNAHADLVLLRRIELDLFDGDGPPRVTQDDRSHPTRHCSSASKSGVTPRPGPGGGAIVPSAAISSAPGSSQSRRPASSPGGS